MEDGSVKEVVGMESGTNIFPNGQQKIYFEVREEVVMRADEEVPIDFISSLTDRDKCFPGYTCPFN